MSAQVSSFEVRSPFLESLTIILAWNSVANKYGSNVEITCGFLLTLEIRFGVSKRVRSKYPDNNMLSPLVDIAS
jgi:hypothetical protein